MNKILMPVFLRVSVALASFLVIWMYANNHELLALMTIILLITAAYITGLIRLWRNAGFGHGIQLWRASCFLGGIMILIFALSTPMDRLADEAFSIHMIQHMLLMKVVAPLLLLGEFSSVFLWAVGRDASHQLAGLWKRSYRLQAIWKQVLNPWFAWSLFAVSLWIWHIPAFYHAALKNTPLHDLEHLSFLGTSLLFWWYLIQNGRMLKVRYGTAIFYLFTTTLHESALGALLTFSSTNWYSFYASAHLWGLSPLSDQQLAGVIMWLPGGILFMCLIVLYFGWWLQAIDKAASLAQMGDSNE